MRIGLPGVPAPLHPGLLNSSLSEIRSSIPTLISHLSFLISHFSFLISHLSFLSEGSFAPPTKILTPIPGLLYVEQQLFRSYRCSSSAIRNRTQPPTIRSQL